MSDAGRQTPLAGIRVLDLSRGPAGALATMVLADFGADVLLVEPPGGDPFRRLPSWPLWLRGKRSRELDLKREDARAELRALARDADVVVFTGTQKRAEALGVSRAQLTAVNPSLVYCSITAWGERGPLADDPGLEGLVAARAGRMFAFTGQQQREGPTYTAVQVGTHAASQGAVHGILASLLARLAGRDASHVETSLLQAMLPFDLLSVPVTQLMASQPEVYGNIPVVGGGMPTLNYHPVMAGDGQWLQCGNLMEHLFYSFLEATDLIGELLADERFQNDAEGWTPEATEFARDRILERLQERTADEWMAIFRAQGHVAIEPYLTTQQALHQQDLVANGDVVVREHPVLGPVRQLGLIGEFTATPGEVGGPAPAIGEGGGRGWQPRAAPAIATPARTAPSAGKPLEGVTILELGTVIATPLGISILADLGARVIKVEPIDGDPFRAMGAGPTIGLMAAKTNAGKESICVDLKNPAGQAIVARIARQSHALVHNYRPGVPERIGIGYEALRADNPTLVWVSANGYGRHSPGAHRPSAHPVPGAAMGGAIHQAGSGHPQSSDRSIPALRETARMLMRANEANPDPNTSMLVASATLLGLLAQQRFGVGQQIYLNMLAANAYANYDDFLDYAGKPPRAPVDSLALGVGALYRLYPTRAGWVFLAVADERAWSALCAALPDAGLAGDARFASSAARTANDAALATVLGAAFATADADSWEARLLAAGVGCVRADRSTVGQFFSADPHALENGFTRPSVHGHFGAFRRWGPLTTVDGGMATYGPGVLAGADTDRLLAEFGYTAAEVAGARAAKVVA
jgi:crotonobetainyl-CoA:carnitine CoA-transferase CaiB-like acyl-CoA transferase